MHVQIADAAAASQWLDKGVMHSTFAQRMYDVCSYGRRGHDEIFKRGQRGDYLLAGIRHRAQSRDQRETC
jgi:hypothetical protein